MKDGYSANIAKPEHVNQKMPLVKTYSKCFDPRGRTFSDMGFHSSGQLQFGNISIDRFKYLVETSLVVGRRVDKSLIDYDTIGIGPFATNLAKSAG